MRVMAIDYGDVRTGVALSDATGFLAGQTFLIKSRKEEVVLEELAALARREGWTEEDWEEELYATLAHEFTHHIEGLAGERGLELKDAQFMEDFRARNGE